MRIYRPLDPSADYAPPVGWRNGNLFQKIGISPVGGSRKADWAASGGVCVLPSASRTSGPMGRIVDGPARAVPTFRTVAMTGRTEENLPGKAIKTCDFLIIGGGIIGLSLALACRRRFPKATILLLEKESDCGLHASGRNSGVLHAGFYYRADSLKARFTRDGCRHWRAYCQRRGLKINPCGKLVVMRDASERSTLETLAQRGEKNGVDLEILTEARAKRIEPRVKTHQVALYSPTTAVIDPRQIIRALLAEAHAANIDIWTGCLFLGRTGNDILSQRGTVSAGYVINAAGLQADRIARAFGFAEEYAILPFKGLYLYSDAAPGTLKTNIYPLPDLNNPFLGVHFTLTVDGRLKVGPTAIPAFWREHYKGMENFRTDEFFTILYRQARLFLGNDFSFRRLAVQEMKKYRKQNLIDLAGHLARLDPGWRWHWGRPGIRAQLLHLPSRRLVMDFLFQGDHHSFHVLNAVSPGFTCAPPFSAWLVERIREKMG